MFPLYAWVILWTGQCFLSPLSLSNQSNKWSALSSVVVTHALKRKKNAFASQLQMGFPVSVVVFLLHPAFTCESIRLPILTFKAARPTEERRVFILTVLFITAVLHSCGANVLYIQMKWVTPVWACLDFILWSFLFLFLNFSGYFFWVLFWFASLRCFSKKKKQLKSSDFKSSYCWY